PTSEFSAVLWLPTDFPNLHLNAKFCAVLAGLSPHLLGAPAAFGYLRRTDSGLLNLTAGRHRCRSLQPAKSCNSNASCIDDSRIRICLADFEQPHYGQ